jgi:hypothetical protein
LGCLEEKAFFRSGLKSIEIPSSVVVLGKESFCHCQSLESFTLESDSRLERIEERAFHLSGLKSIVIPVSVTFVDGSAFAGLSMIWVSPHKMVRFSLVFLPLVFLVSGLLLLTGL